MGRFSTTSAYFAISVLVLVKQNFSSAATVTTAEEQIKQLWKSYVRYSFTVV